LKQLDIDILLLLLPLSSSPLLLLLLLLLHWPQVGRIITISKASLKQSH
jgi:hypothetical protein